MSHELSLTDKTAQAVALAQAVKDMVVLSSEGHAAMEGMRKQSRQMLEALDLEYKQDPRYVAFHDLQAKKLALEKLLKGINTGGKEKQVAWEEAEEKKLQEAEATLAAQLKKNAEDAALARAEANPEQAEAILETVIVPSVVLPRTAPATRSATLWRFKLVDPKGNEVTEAQAIKLGILPRQFIRQSIDLQSIQTLVNSLKSATNIPGVFAYPKKV